MEIDNETVDDSQRDHGEQIRNYNQDHLMSSLSLRRRDIEFKDEDHEDFDVQIYDSVEPFFEEKKNLSKEPMIVSAMEVAERFQKVFRHIENPLDADEYDSHLK